MLQKQNFKQQRKSRKIFTRNTRKKYKVRRVRG